MLNDKLWIFPQDKLKQQLASEAKLRSSYVLAVVYLRTLKANPKATVSDFATDLATVMSKLEARHGYYSKKKRGATDKLSRLSNLLTAYTKAKYDGKLPKISKVSLRPSSLKAEKAGTYSLDLRFAKNDIVVATDLNVVDPVAEFTVPDKKPFECEVTKRLDSFGADLYDSKGDLVSSGNSWIFTGFSRSDTFCAEDGSFSCTSATMFGFLFCFMFLKLDSK